MTWLEPLLVVALCSFIDISSISGSRLKHTICIPYSNSHTMYIFSEWRDSLYYCCVNLKNNCIVIKNTLPQFDIESGQNPCSFEHVFSCQWCFWKFASCCVIFSHSLPMLLYTSTPFWHFLCHNSLFFWYEWLKLALCSRYRYSSSSGCSRVHWLVTTTSSLQSSSDDWFRVVEAMADVGSRRSSDSSRSSRHLFKVVWLDMLVHDFRNHLSTSYRFKSLATSSR